MPSKNAFQNFAPSILRVYHRDKEAFWTAVMAPFLAKETSLLAWIGHIKVDIGLLSAFRGLDSEARELLKGFSKPFGVDITEWKSHRPQYFKDAYPVFAFLAVWMDEQGLTDLLERFDEILQTGVFAVAGYGILDENVDSDVPSPVEILTAQALIAEYETKALNTFGVSQANLQILHRMRNLFFRAEIQEKSLRHRRSPYSLERPEDLGAKGANAVAPFMLSLERLGKISLIENYWQVFLLFGAVIQMIDDWDDLEKDLAAGHYSYVTLDFKNIESTNDPLKTAQILRADTKRIHETYSLCKDMISKARSILAELKDPCLGRLVDVTEARMHKYFRKELKVVSEKSA